MTIYLSVIIATYNSGNCLPELLKSLKPIDNNLLYELIFIDNCSTDGTIELIREYEKTVDINIKLYYEKDSGISDAFNKGVKYSSGKFCLMIGSDDFLVNGWQKKISFTKKLKNDVISFAAIHQNKLGNLLHIPVDDFSYIKSQMCIPHTSTLVLREVCNRFPFDEKYKLAMDYDFFLNIYLNNYSYVRIIEPLSVVGVEGISHLNYNASLREVMIIQKNKGHKFVYFRFIKNCFKNYVRRFLEFCGLKKLIKIYRKKFSLNLKLEVK